MGGYIKRRLPEYLLCVGTALGLALAVLSGFELTGSVASSPLIAAEAVALVVAILYLFAFNRLSTGIGVFAGVVLAILTVFYMQLENPLADEAANSLFVFGLVVVCICVLVFLLTRTKAGTIAVIAVGALVVGGAKFLDFPVPTWALLVFLPCAVGMVLMRVYGKSVRCAFTGFVKSWRYFAQVVGVVAASVVLALAVFFAIIVPLNPPTKDLELLSILRNMETVDVLGLSQTHSVYDPNLLSSGALTESGSGNQQGEEDSDTPEGQEDESRDEPQDQQEDQDSNTGEDSLANNPALQEFLNAIRYDHPELTALVIALLVVVAVAALIGGKLYARKRWYSRVGALSPEDAVMNYYRFFMKRLGMAGFAKAPTMTLVDYARLTAHPLEPFAAEGVTFVQLTDIYLRTFYGGVAPAPQDVAAFQMFYQPFYKNLRREMGLFRYVRKFFRM